MRTILTAVTLSLASLVALAAAPAPFAPEARRADAQDAQGLSAADIAKRIDEVMAAIDKLPAADAGTEKKAQEIAARALDGIDLAKLDAAAFEAAFQLFQLAGPEKGAQYDAAQAERAKQPTAAGFSAAVQRAFRAGAGGSGSIGDLMQHPGFKDGCNGATARTLVLMLDNADAAAIKPYLAQIAGMKSLFTADAPPATFAGAIAWVRVMNDIAPRDQADAARRSVLEASKARLAKADDRAKKSLARNIAVLEGAAMRGELLGEKAPDLEITWTAHADGSPVAWKSLADLKGKVVVLDFWATWCGPCVGSFPKVAELRKSYPADKVEIIGVTSAQGYVAHQKRARVDCKGDVKKEQAETLEFMKDMGVTWTVAMSARDVFNPDFAIKGIPFVAILDQKGKVYKVGLHPSNEADIRKAIDELLAKK